MNPFYIEKENEMLFRIYKNQTQKLLFPAKREYYVQKHRDNHENLESAAA